MRLRISRIYLLFGAAILAVYTVASARGWELGEEERAHVPHDARSTPGGYRSYHFWNFGK